MLIRRSLIFFPAIIGAFLLGLGFTSFNKSLVKNSPVPQVISAKIESSRQAALNEQSGSVRITRVVDGDTIEIEGGQKVRLIGINTPETVDPRQAVMCFGQEASNETKKLLEGKTVTLEKDVSETDKYGRLLRFVFLDKMFVNDYLVRQGFAQVSTYPPDVKFQDQLQEAQKEARDNNRGLWSVCQENSSTPAKSSQLSTSSQPSDSNCQIKGNISSSGEKIYHVPGQQYYNKTQIDGSKGEKWFCDESEAVNAGWRKSKV